jgi:hypothetical protein
LAGAANSTPGAGPAKERQNCPGRSAPIAKIEMIRSGIIEIDRSFDEPKTEESHIEIQIWLRIACDCSYVVKSANFVLHSFIQ